MKMVIGQGIRQNIKFLGLLQEQKEMRGIIVLEFQF
ncbi:hypothetical protein ES319_A13G183000v1 [Gossypium barbadense]|uniref:Uncharacterized protein n=2 Tax=Gossypium TaxID=3633 RepID=A0A5J5T1F3_GOSBA|nr:hypothetical protein ES319_A13G183000v1 [Gossypium barbadense]TYG87203.1 hypothetical protein ES288_A13G194400v1 [Gossypium darwinii]